MSEYELVKKLGSYDNFKGLKSMAKVPRHKLFARNKLSAPTVYYSSFLSYVGKCGQDEAFHMAISITLRQNVIKHSLEKCGLFNNQS
jgi:hypothetical protein